MGLKKSYFIYLISVCFLLVLGGPGQAATIVGAVYQANGITPIPNMQVQLYSGEPCSGVQFVTSAITDAYGTYTLSGLATGTYYIQSNNRALTDYVNEWWAEGGSTYHCAQAEPIIISSAAQTVAGVDFQLDLGGSISGTVYQANGITPITDAVIHVGVFSGNPCGHGEGFGWTQANVSNGAYSLRGIPVGEYYLVTENLNESDYVEAVWASGGSTFQCYGFEPIAITAPGQAVTGKDFQLELGSSISGTVYQLDGVTPVTGVTIHIHARAGSACGVGEGYGNWGAIDVVNGSFWIRGLPAGEYNISTDNKGLSDYVNTWWSSLGSSRFCQDAEIIPITGPGEWISGRNFQLELGGSIQGTVFQEDGMTPVTGVEISVGVSSGVPCGHVDWFGWFRTNPYNGTYHVRGVPIGHYYLLTGNRNESDYVNEWWASEGSTLDCAEAEEVVLSSPGEVVSGKDFQLDLGGRISGMIYESDGGTPVTGVEIRIAVVYTDPCAQGQLITNWAQMNPADGSYLITGVPVGTYHLWANNAGVSSYRNEWWASPLSTVYCDQAQAVVISAPGEVITNKNFQLNQLSGIYFNYIEVISDNRAWSGWRLSTDLMVNTSVSPTVSYSVNGGSFNTMSQVIWGNYQNLYDACVTDQVGSAPSDYVGSTFTWQFEDDPNYLTATATITSGIRQVALSENLFVTGDPIHPTVTWQNADPGLDYYRVRIIDASGDLLWQSPILDYAVYGANPSYTIAGFAFEPGVKYQIRIEARQILTLPFAEGSDVPVPGDKFILMNRSIRQIPYSFLDQLVVDFSSIGLWHYAGGAWSRINTVSPEGMLSVSNHLYVDYGGRETGGYGLYKYDGTWTRIATNDARLMVAVGSDLYVDFVGTGLWKYAGGVWSRINTVSPEGMVAVGNDLYVDYGGRSTGGYGLYKYNGTWSRIATNDANLMVPVADVLFVDFDAIGLWGYRAGVWSRINTVSPEGMIAVGNDLYVDYGGRSTGGYGLYKYAGTWTRVAVDDAAMMVDVGNVLYMDFVGIGLWKYAGGAWSRINTLSPEGMVAVGNDLYVDYGGREAGGYGLYKYDGAWTRLTTSDAQQMIGVNLQ